MKVGNRTETEIGKDAWKREENRDRKEGCWRGDLTQKIGLWLRRESLIFHLFT